MDDSELERKTKEAAKLARELGDALKGLYNSLMALEQIRTESGQRVEALAKDFYYFNNN